jgi:hypothetical protein
MLIANILIKMFYFVNEALKIFITIWLYKIKLVIIMLLENDKKLKFNNTIQL